MEAARKNILIIIPHLYGGGAERVAVELSNYLAGIYNVKIVTFEKWNDREYDYIYRPELICMNLPGGKNSIKKTYTLFKRVKYLRDMKKDMNIDVSISFLDNANIANVLSRRNERVITSVRSLLSARSRSKFYKAAIKLIAKLSFSVVTLSEMVKVDLIENFGIMTDNIITIYNPCDVESISIKKVNKIAEEIRKNKEAFGYKYIVTMGRLMIPKGQWHLLKAFKLVKDQIPNARLCILGEGELQSSLEILAKKLSIDEYVSFLGFVKEPFELIKASDLFVFTSIYEGLGNALIEALACNKAIVSTDCDAGPREILAPNTDMKKKTDNIEYAKYGVLIPSFPLTREIDITIEIDSKEKILANAMCNLLEDDKLKSTYEQSAYARALDFSVENIMSKWIRLLEI